MSIIVKNLTKFYGPQKAVNDISFEIPKGQIVGFLGPNGAGKSTTMKIVTCFIPQSSGSVEVCGLDVAEHAQKVKQKVGYLPEHNPLYTDMYVKEYLMFLARLHKIDNKKERIEEMVKAVGLTKEQHKKIGALSKGYRQRVGLAQAMIHDPEVLILDEPTSGLDPNQLVEIRQLIREIGKEKTVMLSTHIMQEVEAVCDRIIIINDGEIVADDKTDQMQSYISESQIIRVEFDQEISRSKLNNIDGVHGVKKVTETIFLFESKSKDDLRPAISKFAQDQGLLILTIQKEEESLEAVFKKLTQKEN